MRWEYRHRIMIWLGILGAVFLITLGAACVSNSSWLGDYLQYKKEECLRLIFTVILIAAVIRILSRLGRRR